MLQQTQVPRVIEKYKSFIKKFPTPETIARVPLARVLKEWSGLGYNRRGKYLQDAAKMLVTKHKSVFPKDISALRELPGIGPYTASAVRVFAFDLPDVLIETNVRTAYIHHFFAPTKPSYQGFPLIRVADADLIPVATLAANGQDPRQWHWALMDYGTHLKRTGVRNNSRSKHYAKQSKFEGSLRQLRGAILRELHRGLTSVTALENGDVCRGRTSTELKEALAGLERDGLIKQEKGKWRIA